MAINSFEGTGDPVQLPSPSIVHIEDEASNSLDDTSMPIAIIGMGFRGPGDASNVERLWKMILEGREAWNEIPESRWNNHAFYHPDHARHGTVSHDKRQKTFVITVSADQCRRRPLSVRRRIPFRCALFQHDE
jgi:hypothetical protein